MDLLTLPRILPHSRAGRLGQDRGGVEHRWPRLSLKFSLQAKVDGTSMDRAAEATGLSCLVLPQELFFHLRALYGRISRTSHELAVFE